MVRNPKKEKAKEQEATPQPEKAQPIVEREINIALLNDKLNYVISTLNVIAEELEIDLK